MKRQHFVKEMGLLLAPIKAAGLGGVSAFLLFAFVADHMWPVLFSLLAYGVMMSYVVMSQFGAEIEFRCLGLGMTMPWSRRQFWAQKSVVSMFGYLGFGLLLGFVLWCFHIGDTWEESLQGDEVVLCFATILWACFGPGVYLTLRMRNLMVSLWLTCLIPAVLALLFGFLFENMGFNRQQIIRLVFVGSIPYGLLGLWLAKRTFLGWEDLGNAHSSKSANPSRGATFIRGKGSYSYRPLIAMFWREIGIQKLNILFGLILLGGCLGIRFVDSSLAPKFGFQVDFTLIFQIFRYLLYLVPCLCACVTIAESRKWDVHVGELVSPVPRNVQFLTKLLVAFTLGGAFATVFPIVFDLEYMHSQYSAQRDVVGMWIQQSIYVSFFCVIGFYASSMADNFLKSFTIVLIAIPTTILIVQSIGKELRVMHTGLYGVFIFLFFMLLVYAAMMNFRVPKYGLWNLPDQFLRLFLGVVLIVITLQVVDRRSWEYVTLREPEKEASILRQDVQPAIDLELRDQALCLSPDGTLWRIDEPGLGEVGYAVDRNLKVSQLEFDSFEGHWIQLGSSMPYRFGLDQDRELWMWDVRDEDAWLRSGKPIPLQSLHPEKRWKQISAARNRLLALAEDGTLWFGGHIGGKLITYLPNWELVQIDAVMPKLQEFPPHAATPDPVPIPSSDWVDCLAIQDVDFAINASGELFAWGEPDNGDFPWFPLVVTDEYIRPVFQGHGKFASIAGPVDSWEKDTGGL